MDSLISAVEKAAIYDPATGTTVQMNLISPDETEITPGLIASNTTTGVTYGGDNFQATIGFFDKDLISQLQTWQKDDLTQTPINLAIAGESEFILMQDDEFVQVERGIDADAREGATVHMAMIEAVGANKNIYKKVNLIEAGSGAFTEFDSFDTFQYGFVFPIEGVEIVVAADYANFSTAGSLEIRALDFSGSTIQNESFSIISNGRKSLAITLPSNTYSLRIDYDFGNDFSSGDVTNRTIRIGGLESAAYVAY